MANSTVPTKSTGDNLTASEVNNIVSSINSKQDAIVIEPYTNLATNTWNLAVDGRHKTKTITTNTSITVTAVNGDEGFISVTGSGNNVIIAGVTVTTKTLGDTFIGLVNVSGIIKVFSDVLNDTPVNITPPAPTNGVVDDTANTFGYTLSTGYILSDHEQTLNGGTSWATATNPIVVGNVNKAIGQVGVRVKAATGRNVSAGLFNQTAFTATTSSTTPVLLTMAVGIAETAPNSHIWKGSGNNLSDQNAIDLSYEFDGSTNEKFVSTFGASVNDGGFLILSTTGPSSPKSGSNIIVDYYTVIGENIIIWGSRGGSEQQSTAFTIPKSANTRYGLEIFDAPSAPKVRVIFSTDGGTTYTSVTTITPTGGYPTDPMYAGAAISLPQNEILNPVRIQ